MNMWRNSHGRALSVVLHFAHFGGGGLATSVILFSKKNLVPSLSEVGFVVTFRVALNIQKTIEKELL